MRMKVWLGIFSLLLLTSGISFAPEEARVLRFPAIFGNQVVFSYAGDLYTVSSEGGVARKLTTHEGYEAFARFSPDGEYIAFTGEYDGNREVFLVPSQGGVPERLTYTPTLGRDDISDRMGPNNLVMGWKHGNRRIVFRSRMREWNDFNGQLYLASLDGGIPEQVPLPRGGFCSFSPDDKKLAYNRIFREFRTWKRYRGGMADEIWVYDFETKKIENITNNPAQDIIPMWSGNRIYFLSDRDENKRMNLYVYNLESREIRRLTDYSEFDIKFPSIGPEAIVFEYGGHIYRFDLDTEEVTRIPVVIADDLNSGRSKLVKVDKSITNYEISPDGKRALFGARGEVFTVPAKYGNTRNLTNTSGVHERNSKWSPDGKWIAYISDATGEDEIYIMPQDGKGKPQQITTDADTYKYQILWSPDSKKIMWSDKLLRLNYVDIEKKKSVMVAQAKAWEIREYAWSPDSRWIAYSKPETETMTKVYLYDSSTQETHEVTDGWYSSYSPCFHADGKYLFFVSDRDFNPIYSRTEWNYAYMFMSRIYLVTLNKEVTSPFEPKSDEVAVEKGDEKKETNAETKKEEDKKEEVQKKEITVKVDPEELKDRIISLPIEVASYRQMTSVGNTLYYMKRGLRDQGSSLKMYDLEKQKETDLGSINGYEISSDRKKMLVSRGRPESSYAIIDLPKAPIKVEEKLNLSQLEVQVNLREEWNQIFEECWRQMKYFFYDPQMHGVEWEAIKNQYRPLGLLGAQFERDPESGTYKIIKILEGQNWDRSVRSPLTEVGVDVNEGDFLIAINGMATNKMKDMYEALLNTVGKQVTLKVNSEPEDKGSREEVVVPIKDELSLYYYNWVQDNIDKVDKATGGKVGYIHIPNMGPEGLNEFVKHFYPQLRKKALIIDVRGNGGGSVSPMIIERLRREAAMMGVARNALPAPDPDAVLVGPLLCLMDEFSASDGDIFPYRFKKHNLGKLIGKRTWGGVIGIRGSLPLLDGGYLFKPEFATYGLEEKDWIIEGIGVEPDIYVDNDPAREYAGIDEQLNKAIEVILDELKTKEKELPKVPPYPKKKK